MLSAIAERDRAAMLWMQGRRIRGLTACLALITYSGTGKAWVAIAIVLNLLQARGVHVVPAQWQFLQAMLCALAGWSVSQAAKRLFGRDRPATKIPGYVPAVRTPSDCSFPSGHSASSVALFTALAVAGHPLAGVVGAWCALVVFSRFYLGVHFPSDLGGGAALGVVFGACMPLVAWAFEAAGI